MPAALDRSNSETIAAQHRWLDARLLEKVEEDSEDQEPAQHSPQTGRRPDQEPAEHSPRTWRRPRRRSKSLPVRRYDATNFLAHASTSISERADVVSREVVIVKVKGQGTGLTLANGTPARRGNRTPVVVIDVWGIAARADIWTGDVIVSIDGQLAENHVQATAMIAGTHSCRIRYERSIELEVTNSPPQERQSPERISTCEGVPHVYTEELGAALKELTLLAQR